MGVMHSTYSVGALLAPLIATSMIAKAHLPWWNFYYVMVGASFLELVGLTTTFWHKTGEVYRIENPRDAGSKGGRTIEALKAKVTWICALFFFTVSLFQIRVGLP